MRPASLRHWCPVQTDFCTIACVKNDLDLQIYLDVANKRLEELRQQMYPTLFDENKNEELIFIELGNYWETPSSITIYTAT